MPPAIASMEEQSCGRPAHFIEVQSYFIPSEFASLPTELPVAMRPNLQQSFRSRSSMTCRQSLGLFSTRPHPNWIHRRRFTSRRLALSPEVSTAILERCSASPPHLRALRRRRRLEGAPDL